MKGVRLGSIWGVPVTARRPAAVSSLILWAVLALVGWWLLDLSVGAAVAGGFFAVVLHWFADLWHQAGHIVAGRLVGYPMAGLRLHWFLVASYYPRDEPELPPAIHVSRALGGMPASFLLAGLAALAALGLRPVGGVPLYLAWFLAAESLLVFGLGALLPLGFTDGSTLLTWVPRLRSRSGPR